jgi:hypothetical protein
MNYLRMSETGIASWRFSCRSPHRVSKTVVAHRRWLSLFLNGCSLLRISNFNLLTGEVIV